MTESPHIQAGPTATLDAGLRDSIAELNLEIVESHLMAMPGLQGTWRALDSAARLRLAGCPFLLADAGFARPELWSGFPNLGVSEVLPVRALLANRSALSTPLLRRVLLLAWQIARADRSCARIVLGMSGSCAGVVARCRLAELEALAERRPGWIRPRWDRHSELWRAWLLAASRESPRGLECLQLWGLQMIAAEVRRQSD